MYKFIFNIKKKEAHVRIIKGKKIEPVSTQGSSKNEKSLTLWNKFESLNKMLSYYEGRKISHREQKLSASGLKFYIFMGKKLRKMLIPIPRWNKHYPKQKDLALNSDQCLRNTWF